MKHRCAAGVKVFLLAFLCILQQGQLASSGFPPGPFNTIDKDGLDRFPLETVQIRFNDEGQGTLKNNSMAAPNQSAREAPTRPAHIVSPQESSTENSPPDESNVAGDAPASSQSAIEIISLRRQRVIRLCRVSRACTVGDGSVLLPAWMKSYKSHLEQCGLSNALFVLHTVRNNSGIEMLETRDMGRPIELTEQFSGFDLLGTSPPRDQRQDLVIDMLPLLLVVDVLKNPVHYNGSLETLCVKQGGHSCEQGVFDFLHLTIPVTTAVAALKDTSWIKGFFRLIRNGLLGNLRLTDTAELYGWRVRGQAACVRSIIASEANGNTMPDKAIVPNHFLYAENELSRSPRVVSSTLSERGCHVRIMILNRFGKRYMIGDTALSLAISVEAHKATVRYPYLRIQSEVVFFENSSFHEQIAMTQEANVIIASHGEANTNALFLRPGSALIEVMPFGYKSGPYDTIARIFDIEYGSVIAQPDEEVFKSCINHFNPNPSPAREKFLELWNVEAKRARASTNSPQEPKNSDFWFDSDDDPRLHGINKARQCMGFQRLSFNVQSLAQRVVRIAMKQCGADATRQPHKTVPKN